MSKKLLYALNTTTPDAASPTIHYELTNHLGNVMAVITDEPAATETPTVESLTDYYPFGMTMPGRSYNAHTYRHGFTGHEKESDLAEGIYTTDYRLYDARVGRWLSVDPLWVDNAGESPYLYCSGIPMTYFDPDGREKIISFDVTGKYDKRTDANEFLTRFFNSYNDNDDIIHVCAHGNKTSFIDKYGEEYTAEGFHGFLISYSKLYTDKQLNSNNKENWEPEPCIVVLHSCSTGGGSECLAQEISKDESTPLVFAPSITIRVSDREEVISEGIIFDTDGVWNVYYKGIKVDQLRGTDSGWFKKEKAVQINEFITDMVKDKGSNLELLKYYESKYNEIQKNNESTK